MAPPGSRWTGTPSRVRPGATSARSPAAAGCRAPRRRPARRAAPVRVRRADPRAATRRATARGGRRSARMCGARCGGAGRSLPQRGGASRARATRSPGPSAVTTPRSAASVTACVLSRSARLLLGIARAEPGLRASRADEVGHMPVTPDAHRGGSAKRLKVFTDHRQGRRRHAHRQHVVGGTGFQQPPGACPHRRSGVPGVRSFRHCASCTPAYEFQTTTSGRCLLMASVNRNCELDHVYAELGKGDSVT